MASQQPGHNQDQQPYQAFQAPHSHPPQQELGGDPWRDEGRVQERAQSGPGVNAPLLDFNAGSGRYEAPTNPQHGGQYGSQSEGGFGGAQGGGFGAVSGGAGFGGEHEGGYQVPAGAPHGGQPQGGQSGGGFGGGEFGGGHGGALGGEHQGGYEAPPGLPPRRTDTGAALPQGQDRSHQVEVMQSYEMSRAQTEDEQNQAILQREFPKMDSSLIAAIYGDSGSLSATRELLQELGGGEEQ